MEKPSRTADGRRSVSSVPLLTVTLLTTSAFLLRAAQGDTTVPGRGGAGVHLQDYAILGAGGPGWERGCGEPSGGGAGEESPPLKLSELVAQSDVIFKAFAGHGNDLRDDALNRSADGSFQQHHQPRWKAGERAGDGRHQQFVVRLEPATVYKGNELFQQLQLNSWKHYFIIWSNGSVGYSHRGAPTQGRPSGTGPSLDGRPFASSEPGATEPSGPDRMKSYPVDSDDRNTGKPSGHSETSGRILNCTAWKLRRRRGEESAPPSISEPPGSNPTTTGQRQPTADRKEKAEDAGEPKPPPAPTGRNPSTASERVNLRDAPGTPIEPAESMPMDWKTEGQISHTLSEILPVTLIVFGRRTGDGAAPDNSLRVDPYVGLLRWDERLEEALWRALGWSKWSDYTGCSVGCGAGVQQRFRHCLLPGGGGGQRPPAPPSSGGVERTPTNPSAASIGVTMPSVGTSFGEDADAQDTAVHAAPGASTGGSLSAKGKKKPIRPAKYKTKRRDADRDKKDAINQPPRPTVESFGLLTQRDSLATPSPGGSSDGHQQNRTPAVGTWGPPCEGHNIEQRSCNMFDCTGTIDLLTALAPESQGRNWDEGIDDRINYEINQLEQNFTLMISLRVRRRLGDGSPFERDTGRAVAPGGSILSVRSKLTTGASLSINFVTNGHGGLRVIQEKYGLSEMLPVREPALLDGDWHSLALSGRNGGGFVTVYGDCRWINSFVLTKGSIELPQYPTVEVGRDVELRQLTVVPGEKSARLQCHSTAVPIRDVDNRQVTNYFEHLN